MQRKGNARGAPLSEEDKSELLTDLVIRLLLACYILQIPAKVGQGGRIFGSINGYHIQDRLEQLGISVKRRDIILSPVKTIGIHLGHVTYKGSTILIRFNVFGE